MRTDRQLSYDAVKRTFSGNRFILADSGLATDARANLADYLRGISFDTRTRSCSAYLPTQASILLGCVASMNTRVYSSTSLTKVHSPTLLTFVTIYDHTGKSMY